MSKILNHNTSFLKVELDNGSVLFLHKKDMEVYAEANTIYLKQPSGINSFPFDSLLDPKKPTLVESVKGVQAYLDEYILFVNDVEEEVEASIPLSYSELRLDDISINGIKQIELLKEIVKYLKKIYNPL